MNDAQWLENIHLVTRAVELAGIGVILAGALISVGFYVRQIIRGPADTAYRQLRSNLGRSILLGLELLVAADIINTVAIAPTMDSIYVLAGIVLIRTFLSFSLEVEIEGRWPWQAKPEGPAR